MTIDIFPTFNLLARPGATISFPPFTREGESTRIDATGARVSVASNTLRHDFERNSGVYRGLLLEGRRDNLLLNSLAPASQTVTLDAGTYTLSVHGAGSATLSGAASGSASEGTPLTVTTGGGSVTVTVTGTPDAFQLELGAFASSVIPTTSVSGRRDYDGLYGSIADIAMRPDEGTLYVEASTFGLSHALTALELSSDQNNRLSLRFDGSRRPSVMVKAASVVEAEITASTAAAADAPVRMAVAYASGEVSFCVAGTIIGTAAPAALPAVTHLLCGVNIGATECLYGHFRHGAYFPRRLSDADLQLLTR
ncbi:hypothetical protein C882_1987 [Caenispirillum salinarum AK4]|uniref:Uncharacterized protein n=1 Tax=Caenispirillum salinarum AK4 TaxID=1238182 RepID=K9H8Z1_9PROT|nr:hypothetical protein [Caenispirillum salinarum]EKV27058.1 hypothetical protein C882_1987 [Caenispirillum salinarum AK4]